MQQSVFILLFSAFMLQTSLSAQREETLVNRDGARFSGIWGVASNNYSAFNDNWIYSRGGYGGLEFGRTVFIGWGGYKMREDVDLGGVSSPFRMKYNVFVLGLMPNSRRAIHPRINLMTGRGRISTTDDASDRVFVFQPSGGIELNVFQWFRVGLEGGYRFVMDSEIPGLENNKVSAPFAQLDLRFGIAWGR